MTPPDLVKCIFFYRAKRFILCVASPIDVRHTVNANRIFTNRLILDYWNAHALMTVQGYRTYVSITCIGCLKGRDWDIYRPLPVEGGLGRFTPVLTEVLYGNQIQICKFVQSDEIVKCVGPYSRIKYCVRNNLRFKFFFADVISNAMHSRWFLNVVRAFKIILHCHQREFFRKSVFEAFQVRTDRYMIRYTLYIYIC